MDTASFKKRVAAMSAFAIAGQIFAQEVNFSDYVQPPEGTRMGHISMDNFSFYNVGVTGYSIGVNFSAVGYIQKGVRFYNWPPNGDAEQNGKSGLGIPIYGDYEKEFDNIDLAFMYKPETGAPRKYRIDLYNGTYWDWGTPTNGGVINLTGTVGAWNHFRTRRINTSSDGYGNTTKPGGLRIVAIQNSDNNYPGFDGTYTPASGITFDCVRAIIPRRLNGLYKVTGTTNKNVGTVTFNKTGGRLQFNDWIQNLGNVDIVNIFGTTTFGNLSTASYSSGLMYTYLDGGSVRQFGLDRLAKSLNSVQSNSWIGTGVTGNAATDKFFGFFGVSYPPQCAMVLRQVTTGVYSHYFRTLDNNNGYASEVPVNLGGEQLVAVADVNGDAMDDVITRSGTTLKVRPWTDTSGAWPYVVPTFGPATTLTTYGYLKCIGTGDFNDDGIADLLLSDSASGDVFSLLNTSSGSTLQWMFQLNVSQGEKVYAITDADSDGYPDIYSTRQKSPGVGEMNIRKMNPTGQSIASIGVVAEFNYTTFKPCAIGDINGDGSADIVLLGNDAPYYSVISFLVNPVTRGLLQSPQWICNAGTPLVRPIYYYNPN